MNTSHFILSYEFYPPKTPEGIEHLQQAAKALAQLNPDYFSVTFGAGGSTRVGTLETVQRLQPLGIPIAPHIACVGLTQEELMTILESYRAHHVNRLVVLRGDIPSGMGTKGTFHFASELVAFIRQHTQNDFHIEVAAYPEVHPQAQNAWHDLYALKTKMDAGANSAITQYFFHADAYFYFVDACQKQGITLPIIPGIMPITHFSRLQHFSEMCGAEIPRWIRKRLEAYGDDPSAIQAFGLEVIHSLCERLIEYGAPGLHFYTLNHAEISLKLAEYLGLNVKATAS